MYLRSAPLQKMPAVPRRTTTRTAGSRASCRPALRRSRAVDGSSELKRFGRSMVSVPTPRSTAVRMWLSPLTRPSADPRHRIALRLGKEPLAQPGVEDDPAPLLGDAGADHRGAPPEGVAVQRPHHPVQRLGVRPEALDRVM